TPWSTSPPTSVRSSGCARWGTSGPRSSSPARSRGPASGRTGSTPSRPVRRPEMTVELTRERTVQINAAAWEFWRFHANSADDWTRAYLAARGLRGLQAGYAPEGWARLVGRMRGRGFSADELVAAGLAFRTESGSVGDVFRDRLVLAYRDEHGDIVGFSARRNPALDDAGDAPAKYLNTTTTPAF